MDTDYEVITKDAKAEYSVHYDDLADANRGMKACIKSGKWLSVEIIKTTSESVAFWEKE